MVELVSETNQSDISREFHLEELSQALQETTCKSIALQFPDNMLEKAPEVTMELDMMLKTASQLVGSP